VNYIFPLDVVTVQEKRWTYGEKWRVCHPAAVFNGAISPITDSKMTVLYLKHHMCTVLIIIYILKKRRAIATDELEKDVVILCFTDTDMLVEYTV